MRSLNLCVIWMCYNFMQNCTVLVARQKQMPPSRGSNVGWGAGGHVDEPFLAFSTENFHSCSHTVNYLILLCTTNCTQCTVVHMYKYKVF